MKTVKKLLSAILAVAMVISIFAVASTASAVSTVKKTMMQYTSIDLDFGKSEKRNFQCAVANNKDGYIKVRAEDWGGMYRLQIDAKKVQKSGRNPVVTIYEDTGAANKTIIKKYQIKVTEAKKVEMKNYKFNKGVEKKISFTNPYAKYYRFEYNKKIISIKQLLYAGNKEQHLVTGLKTGKTTVKVYLEGTKKLVGQFTVTIGDYKASIKDSYKSTTIYYNKHINTLDLNNGYLDISKAISNYHENSQYTVSISNTNKAGSKVYPDWSYYYHDSKSKFAHVYSKATGTVTLTVYEKRGKNAKKKIGTIKLTIKQGKDSNVYSSYREMDNDGIFYENFISPGDSYDLKNAVVGRYMNPQWVDKKYYFKESEYTFTAKSSNPDIISVDSNGVCHCHRLAYSEDVYPYITYTVTFKDGSKVTGGGEFDIVDEDFTY